jgi:5'-nucleotidase/UDP-sugar diphosphatase
MKKASLCILFLSSVMALSGQNGKKITILHTNDLHSRLTGFAPESAYTPETINDDKTTGGFARIATIIKDEKAKNPEGTLVVDAGDFLMGTLFHSLEKRTGFQLRLMNQMGYDITCLGNHEFDFGPESLAEILASSSKAGEIPAILAGNAVFSKKDSRDNGLEELEKSNVLARKVILTRDGIKIGFFSLIGEDAVSVAPRSVPVEFSKQLSYARKMVKELKYNGCDIIICVSHSGLSKDVGGNWVGEDYKLAQKVVGINLIISGHTHSKVDEPLIVNGIPIVQAGEYGNFVGKLSLIYTSGKLTVENYSLIPVDDKIPGDKSITALIEKQKELIATEILSPLGISFTEKIAETSFPVKMSESGDYKESNLGPLVADAIHYYVNSHDRKGTDVSLVALGVLRDNIVPGIQTAPDIFRVMSLGSGKDEVPGYPLSRLYVTGKELKSILEILMVAYKKSADYYCYYSGLKVEYDPSKRTLKKIQKITIIHPDGEAAVVSFSKKDKVLYSLTANSYMLDFIGIIKKMSYGLINVVPKDSDGNRITIMQNAVIDMNERAEGIQEGKEWLALMQYLGSMKDTNGNGIPDIDLAYAKSVKCFFQIKAK